MKREQLHEHKGVSTAKTSTACQAHLNLTEGAQCVVPGWYQVVQDAV